MNRTDISQGLISENDIRNNLQTIFPDSVIIKNQFKIVAVSNSILLALGYEESDLIDHSIEILTDDQPLTPLLERQLNKGFFDEFMVSLKGKGNAVTCKISGFYLGLISDINNIAVVKIKPVDDSHIKHQLETSRNELDEFVYRTTHDLRGPLATMKGLINLMKMEQGSVSDNMKYLIQLLDTHSQTLDDRLFHLNYLSESGQSKTIDNLLDCEALESTLRSTIEENMPINCIDLLFTSTNRTFHVVNTQLTISMLNHLLLYLINLPKGSEAKLVYTLEEEQDGMRATISSEGFLSNYQLRQALRHKNPLYTTVIMYSDLINFFAAMKNAQRLGTTIQVDSIYEMSQQISVVIPFSKAASY